MISIKPNILLVSICFIFFIYEGYKGIDFGTHWDELSIINSIHQSFSTGLFLPRWYNYPSLTYLVGLLYALSSITYDFGRHIFDTSSINFNELHGSVVDSVSAIKSESFKLELRLLFVIITATSAFFTYSTVRLIGSSRISAAMAAAFLLANFQVLYHSRWIAPDTLLLTCTAIVINLSVRAIMKGRSSDYCDGIPSNHKLLTMVVGLTIIAALAMAAKYPGGLLMTLPIYVAFVTGQKHIIPPLALLGILVFVMITPGSVIEPYRFVRDIINEVHHYKTLGHGVYTIDSGLTHLGRIVDFVTFRIFSINPIVSIILVSLACFGFYSIFQEHKRVMIIFILPIVYVAYFCTQRVMIIRNLLLIIPFMSVLLGIGLNRLINLSKARRTILVVMLLMLLINLTMIHTRTRSLYPTVEWTSAINKYVSDEYKEGKYVSLSDGVKAIVGDSVRVPNDKPANTRIFISTEGKEFRCANVRDAYKVIAGPDEIDLDYYPLWIGQERIVAMNRDICK